MHRRSSKGRSTPDGAEVPGFNSDIGIGKYGGKIVGHILLPRANFQDTKRTDLYGTSNDYLQVRSTRRFISFMSLTARDFLTEIYDDLSGFIGIFGTDPAGNWNRSKWFAWPQEAEDAIQAVEWDWSNTVGYAPFVYSDRKRATDEHAITRLIALDADYHTPDQFRLTPTYAIETSPGSFHVGWLLLTPVTQAEAVALGRNIRDTHNLEASASSTTKILRIPGTHNADSEKATVAGSTFPVVGHHSGSVYELEDLIAEYPPVKGRNDTDPGSIVTPPHIAPFPETLPTKFVIESKLPAHTPRIDLLMDWRAEEQIGPERDKRSERIHELCHLLFEAGLEPEDVVAYAWEAQPVQEHYVQKGDPRPIQDFWRYDVIPAWNKHQRQQVPPLTDQSISQAPDTVQSITLSELPNVTESVTNRNPESISLLTEADWKIVNGYESFIDRWIVNNKMALDPRTPVEYAISTGYLLLAAALGDCAHTFKPSSGLPIRSNVFFLTLGPTTSGKSQSRQFFLETLQQLETAMGTDIFLGTDATPEGLVRSLSASDGRTALIATDEVSRMFSDWASKKYNVGAPEVFMELYGNVVPRLRRSNKDTDMTQKITLGGFNAYFMGTPEKVFEVLPEDFYFSGFMQRVIPVLGYKESESESEYRKNLMIRDASKAKAYKTLPAQIGQYLLDTRSMFSGDPAVEMTDEAANKWADIKVDMKRSAAHHEKREYIEAVMERLGDSVLKLALALAVSDRVERIELHHILSVARHAEAWTENVFTVLESISASEFSRKAEDVVRWVITVGGKVSMQSVHRHLAALPPRDRGDILDSLKMQGRLVPQQDDKGRHWLVATEV